MKSKEIEICRNAFSLAQRNLEKSQKQTEVFKNLQKIIPAEILEQIESPKKPLHCIFVISSDFDLVAGIASYIYHVYASGSFTHLSYSGYTDQQIISDLFPPSPPNKFRLDHYLKGRTLFISGLGNNHRLVFKRLLGVFREINFSNPYKKEFGFLIISVEDIALIPQELMNLSDMIGIKSAKKDLPAGTPESIPEDTSSYLLNNTNYLHIGRTPIKLAPSHADFLRFMVNESKGSFLELQYILTYHYGIETMNKMTLSKDERRPFDKEANKINTQCKKALQKDLIKSLGDKKYTLSINIKLPKNSPKDSP